MLLTKKPNLEKYMAAPPGALVFSRKEHVAAERAKAKSLGSSG
jgi:hypothetical protein